MSLLAILTVAGAQLSPASPPTRPNPETADQIVVMGQKLKGWKGGVSKVGGRMVCKTSKSSGDKALDAIRCGAMLGCMKPLEARIDALMGSDLALGVKKARFRQLTSGLEDCAAKQEAQALARLAGERNSL